MQTTFLTRLAVAIARPRSILAAAATLAAAAAVAVPALTGGAAAGASTASAAAASYAALASQQPSGLTLVTSHDGADGGTPHPTWPAAPPEGAGPNWPDASTIRPLRLSVPGLSGWIASSTGGGVCILLYDGEAVQSNAAVYSSCSAEGRLGSGAGAHIEQIPGRPGIVVEAGVVPNGVSAVTATLADGSTETLPVDDNAWARESSDPIEAGTRPAWTTGG